MKIFFYGGTFDPPHIGHKMIVEKLLPSCDKLIVFPAKKSPVKKDNPVLNVIYLKTFKKPKVSKKFNNN